jgi:hypothetical protein
LCVGVCLCMTIPARNTKSPKLFKKATIKKFKYYGNNCILTMGPILHWRHNKQHRPISNWGSYYKNVTGQRQKLFLFKIPSCVQFYYYSSWISLLLIISLYHHYHHHHEACQGTYT